MVSITSISSTNSVKSKIRRSSRNIQTDATGKCIKKEKIDKVPSTPKKQNMKTDLETSPQLKKKSKLSLKSTENVVNLSKKLTFNNIESNELTVENNVLQNKNEKKYTSVSKILKDISDPNLQVKKLAALVNNLNRSKKKLISQIKDSEVKNLVNIESKNIKPTSKVSFNIEEKDEYIHESETKNYKSNEFNNIEKNLTNDDNTKNDNINGSLCKGVVLLCIRCGMDKQNRQRSLLQSKDNNLYTYLCKNGLILKENKFYNFENIIIDTDLRYGGSTVKLTASSSFSEVESNNFPDLNLKQQPLITGTSKYFHTQVYVIDIYQHKNYTVLTLADRTSFGDMYLNFQPDFKKKTVVDIQFITKLESTRSGKKYWSYFLSDCGKISKVQTKDQYFNLIKKNEELFQLNELKCVNFIGKLMSLDYFNDKTLDKNGKRNNVQNPMYFGTFQFSFEYGKRPIKISINNGMFKRLFKEVVSIEGFIDFEKFKKIQLIQNYISTMQFKINGIFGKKDNWLILLGYDKFYPDIIEGNQIQTVIS